VIHDSMKRSILCGMLLVGVAGLCPAQSPLAYTISTVAGQSGVATFGGDGGKATSAGIGGPFAVAVDSSGNFYISDQFNNRVRKVDTSGNISTVAGNGTAGFSGDGGSATSAELNSPAGVALDSSGNLYIADSGNFVVRKVAGSTISTVAGNNGSGAGYAGDGAAATSAQLNNPAHLAFDAAGNLYIADPGNNVVRKVNTSGTISTVAGIFSGGAGYTGDGGQATQALLANPEGVAVDHAGNLYIADTRNNVIRKVDTKGVITTVAGNGALNPGFTGDGGPATQASLNGPKGVAVDAAGNLFIADSFNSAIRVVLPNGIITTIAGNPAKGAGFSGDGGPATSAQLFFPSGVTLSGGKIYVADNQNDVIRLLTPVPAPPTINAGGVITAGDFGASPAVAPGSWIEIYGTNLGEDTRTWGGGDFSGANAPTSLDGTSVTIGGKAAFVEFVSPLQVNVQVPSDVTPGAQPLVLTTALGSSAAYTVTVNATQPGLYTLPQFNIGGKQYVGAVFSDFSTFVMPTGAVSGFTTRPAKPGDIITIFGVGFGAVTPDIPAGQIVGQQNSLAASFQIQIGDAPATLQYWGLAPQAVGLYQFNVVVPQVPSGDAVPLTFTLGGTAGTQTLYIAVQN
jgi:uncharacterized protein (TIGR03437 family)